MVGLETGFWEALDEITNGRSVTLSDLLAIIDADRHDTDLASAIRVFVLGYYRDELMGTSSSEMTKLSAAGHPRSNTP